MGPEVDRAVLPRYNAVIVDEAHNAADVATEHFGRQASRISLVRLTNAIYGVNARRQRLPTLLLQLPEAVNRLKQTTVCL